MKYLVVILFTLLGMQFVQAETSVIGIDVRTQGEVKSMPAPGSINIPMAELTRKIEETVKDKNQEIYLFCASGGRSASAKLRLEKMGYTKVKNILTWKDWNKYKSSQAIAE